MLSGVSSTSGTTTGNIWWSMGPHKWHRWRKNKKKRHGKRKQQKAVGVKLRPGGGTRGPEKEEWKACDMEEQSENVKSTMTNNANDE